MFRDMVLPFTSKTPGGALAGIYVSIRSRNDHSGTAKGAMASITPEPIVHEPSYDCAMFFESVRHKRGIMRCFGFPDTTVGPSDPARRRTCLAYRKIFFWKAFLSIEKPIGQNP